MTVSTSNALAGLAGRLTDPQDRERYAAIVLYLQALPPEDDFRHLAELLGLLSLMGQRIPEAAAELLAELRAQTKAAGEYHRQVDVRLASLPQEIASGVDVGAIAETMSEAFRQQLAATGLRDSAVSLDSASRATKALAGQIFGTLKPASEDLKALTATISTELVRLAEASSEIQRHNHRLILRDRSQRWVWQGVAALALFLFGGLAGIVMEKRETTNVLTNMASQIERVQTPVSPTVQVPRKNRKQGGLQQQLNEQQQIQGKPR